MTAPAAAPLERAFFARPAPDVARDLVGKLLIRADERLSARIVETEAYTQDDPACHAYGGRTQRNAPLFGPPGHAYVYFTYGMHWCLNTATGREGRGEGVLLRAAEPLAGLDRMRSRRGRHLRDRDLLRGPARLAQAFGLDGAWSSTDLCDDGPLRLADDGTRPAVETSPRVGVVAAADRTWRFVAAGSPWASAYKRHPRA
jgi:DNA-3-methyladenine glycosylase